MHTPHTFRRWDFRILLPALILTLGVIISAGCRRVEDTVYSHFQRIESSGWNPDDYITFMPWPADSAATFKERYDFILHFRYKASRKIKPFPILLTVEDDEGNFRTDTIRVELFSPSGKPLGSGERGLYLLSDTLLRNRTLLPGTLVTLAPLAPQQMSRGLLDIGLSLTVSKSRPKNN